MVACSNSFAQSFTKLTNVSLSNDAHRSGASFWADYDGDNDLDLVLFGLAANDPVIYRNDCDGNYTEITDPSTGSFLSGYGGALPTVLADFNNDGYPELVLVQFKTGVDFYDNNGDGTFSQRTTGILLTDTLAPRSVAAVDYDNDGWNDLLIANQGIPSLLYHNNGDGTFSKVIGQDIVTDVANVAGAAWADCDNDGYMDLFIGNRTGTPNLFYKNNGDGTFTKNTSSPIATLPNNTYGPTWVDYDNDLDLDIFIQNAFSSDFLFMNNLSGDFTAVTTTPLTSAGGLGQASASWGDYDNDGDLDCFIANLTDHKFFSNNGDGTFTQITNSILTGPNPSGTESAGANWIDYDNDGDLDLYVLNGFGGGPDYNNFLYRNDGNANHFMKFHLTGTTSNKDAIGARVYVYATINGNSVSQMREVNANSMLGGGGDGNTGYELHFGMGDAANADSVIVVWPTSGLTQSFQNVIVDQSYNVSEGNPLVQLNNCLNPVLNVSDLEGFAIIGDTISVDTLITNFTIQGNIGYSEFLSGDVIFSNSFLQGSSELQTAQDNISSIINYAANYNSPIQLNGLNNRQLSQGVYKLDNDISLNTKISLIGDENSIFLFYIDGNFTFSENSYVELIGVKSHNVFFVSEGATSIENRVNLSGNIIASDNIYTRSSVAGYYSLFSEQSVHVLKGDDQINNLGRSGQLYSQTSGPFSILEQIAINNQIKVPLTIGCGYLNSANASTDNYVIESDFDVAGNLCTVGNFIGSANIESTSGTTAIGSNGTSDGYIVSHDPAGNLLWNFTLNPLNPSDYGVFTSIVHTLNDDAFIVGGRFLGTIKLDGTTQLTTSTTAPEIFYLKLDNSGQIIWAYTDINGGGELAADPSGDFYTFYNTSGNSSVDLDNGNVTLTAPSTNTRIVEKRSGANGQYVWGQILYGGFDGGQSSIDYNPATNEVVIGAWHDYPVYLGSYQIEGLSNSSDASFILAMNSSNGSPIAHQTYFPYSPFTQQLGFGEVDLHDIDVDKDPSSVYYGSVYGVGKCTALAVSDFNDPNNPYFVETDYNSTAIIMYFDQFHTGYAEMYPLGGATSMPDVSLVELDVSSNGILHILGYGKQVILSAGQSITLPNSEYDIYYLATEPYQGGTYAFDKFDGPADFSHSDFTNDIKVNNCQVAMGGGFDNTLNLYSSSVSSFGTKDSWMLTKEVPDVLSIQSNSGSNLLCSGSLTLTAISPTNPSSYIWYQDGTVISGSTGSSIVVSTPGVYSVQISTSCCSNTSASFEVESPSDAFQIIPSATTVCTGGSITLTTDFPSFGSLPVMWSTGQTASTITVSPTTTTTYSATYNNFTGLLGCPYTSDITINVLSAQPPSLTSSQTPACFDETNGSATVTPSGGLAPYSYQWNAAANNQTTATAVNLAGNTSYNVTVIDANGCLSSLSVSVSENGEIIVTEDNTSSTSCDLSSDGFSTVLASGGTSPFTYQWDSNTGNQTGPTASGLSVGTYTVTVTDAINCEQTLDIDILSNEGLVAATIVNSGGCNVAGQSILLNDQNPEVSTFTYDWLFGINEGVGSGYVTSHSYSEPGTYMIYLSVSDGCGNTAIDNQIIEVIDNECGCDFNDNANGTIYTYPDDTDDASVGYFLQDGDLVGGTITVNNVLSIPPNATIKFGPLGKILVGQTGTLQIGTGATLTSLDAPCDLMWKGIEVHQDNGSEGTVNIGDGANIENAHIGILLGALNNCVYDPLISCLGIYDLSKSGGNLVANNVNFLDNGISVKANRTLPNSSISAGVDLTDCSFSTTIGGSLNDVRYNNANSVTYPNSANPAYGNANFDGRSTMGVYLDGVVKPKLNFALVENIEIGIEAYDSPFNISAGDYENLKYGIRIFNTGSVPTTGHRIESLTFTDIKDPSGALNNSAAIQIEGGSGDRIIGNTFGDVLNSQTDFPNVIYFENTNNYRIEDNSFQNHLIAINANNSGAPGGYIGTRTDGSGENEFIDCERAIVTDFNNLHLTLRCNLHNNQSSPYNKVWQDYGDLGNQGNTTVPFAPWKNRTPAGNEFDPPGRKEIDALANSYLYIHHPTDVNGQPTTVPTEVGLVSKSSFGGQKQLTSCIPYITQYIGPKSAMIGGIGVIDGELSDLQDELGIVISQLDGGDTQLLLDAINSTMPSDELKNLLLSNFPLSDEVLIAYIARQDVSGGHFKQVIVANSPVSDPVRPFLMAKLGSLPNGIANQINAVMVDNGDVRTPAKIQIEMEALEQDRQQLESILIATFIEDDDLTGLINYLYDQGSNESLRMLTDIYLAENQLTDAGNILSSVNIQTTEEIKWEELSGLQLSLYDQQLSLADLDAVQINQLENYILTYPSDPSVSRAKAWLRLATDLDYPLYLPVANKSYYNSNTKEPDNEIDDVEINLYPNPANNLVYLTGNFGESSLVKFELIDLSGRIVLQQTFGGATSIQQFNLNQIASGTYIYTVKVNNTIITTNRLVITK